MKERLQKIMSQSGLCSRRTAELWLTQGRVRVNGAVAKVGDQADLSSDTVEVDGLPIRPVTEHVYLMLHKPRGFVTTLSDEKGRRTAAELVADCGRRVFPVGRLDMDSEGLLLFTDDGAMMQALTHPKGEVDKVYRVTVRGALEGAAERLAAVDELDGESIRPAQVREVERSGGQAVLEVTIHQGKNRQIRRMCSAASLQVQRLIRIREHTLSLGDLPAGCWRYLTETEISELKGSEEHE